MKEIGELVANLLCLDKQIGISDFLRFEWMYAKFKNKVLKNSRLNLGIWNDVFPHNFLLKYNGQ